MKILFSKNFIDSRGGFTVIETMIAVALVAIVVSPLILSVAAGLDLTQNAKNRIIAAYLAEEAIEVVRNLRDQNYIQGYPNGWDDIMEKCNLLSSGYICKVDPHISASETDRSLCLDDGPDGDCTIESVKPGDNFGVLDIRYVDEPVTGLRRYGHNPSWTPTPQGFRRNVTVSELNNSMFITVYITWIEDGKTAKYITSATLFNWLQ